MMLSQYNGEVVPKNTWALFWVFYALFQSNFRFSFFTVASLVVFSAVTLLIRQIKNKRLNLCAAVLSILVYSVGIDVVCYYFYPQFVFGQNLLSYVWNGMLFNLKYVLSNVLVAFFLTKMEEQVFRRKSQHKKVIHGLFNVRHSVKVGWAVKT
jgi:hypothetical protein